jgi:hypothetical protein
MMILACLQVTRNPIDQQRQLSNTHIDPTTYASADKIGPLDTKGCPVDNTLEPWIRVGYENKLNIVIPFTFITRTYSTKAASNFLVSEKGLNDESTKATHSLVKVMVCVSALTQIDNDTASINAEKDLRSNLNILRKR